MTKVEKKSLGFVLANRLKQFRQENDHTQGGLAAQLGLARATVNKWESAGAGKVTLNELEKIGEKTGIPVAELLGIESGINPDQLAKISQNLTQALNQETIVPLDILNDLKDLDPSHKNSAWIMIRGILAGLRPEREKR